MIDLQNQTRRHNPAFAKNLGRLLDNQFPEPLHVSPALHPVALCRHSGAASSYRPDAIGLGGYAVNGGPEDTENLRQRYVQLFGRPVKTFVIGASEGGIITAAMAERFGLAADGPLNYDGVLPLCGPLAGGRRNSYGAFDLRVVYQYYCRNLPRTSESQYPLYFGLAPNNALTPNDLARSSAAGRLAAGARRRGRKIRQLVRCISAKSRRK